jgi:hypothetical protein
MSAECRPDSVWLSVLGFSPEDIASVVAEKPVRAVRLIFAGLASHTCSKHPASWTILQLIGPRQPATY